MLLIIHQKIEEFGPLDRHRFREILAVVFNITDDVMLDLTFRAFDHDNDGYVCMKMQTFANCTSKYFNKILHN